ncbi:MAG: transcriptional regulator FtsR [Acidimicrobiales bacterium]
MPDRTYLSIGQVLDLLKAEFPDLTISKIRFLESQGLLDPERTPSGYRKFYDGDVERLRFILREQQEHYLPLKVIKGRLGVDEDFVAVDPLAGLSPAPSVSAAGPVPSPVGGDLVPRLELVDAVDDAVGEEVSLTLQELAATVGLTAPEISELERFGLVSGRRMAGSTYYDADALEIATLAAGFRSFGVEARHLRMYRTTVEREAGFFEQVVTPMFKQRNPQARRQAVDTLYELSRLGSALRVAMLRQALRDYIGGP